MEPQLGTEYAEQKGTFFFTVFMTVITSFIVSITTKPESIETLKTFYNRVKPNGFWNIITGEKNQLGKMKFNFIAWISGMMLTYSILFGTGYYLFDNTSGLMTCIGLIVVTFTALVYSTKRIEL